MGKRNVPEEGWTPEGAAWLDSLDWDDAQFLLTTQQGEPLTAEDEERVARLRQSYESATGETWK